MNCSCTDCTCDYDISSLRDDVRHLENELSREQSERTWLENDLHYAQRDIQELKKRVDELVLTSLNWNN